MVGSDGPCVAPYGITGQGKPHPRLYGTFPRVLGHYARDLGLLGLPQAVYKMTGGAAAALGLADRGTIAEGNAADLVLFDPEKITDPARFDDPHQYPVGIDTVIVNGVAVIDGGEQPVRCPGDCCDDTAPCARELTGPSRHRGATELEPLSATAAAPVNRGEMRSCRA